MKPELINAESHGQAYENIFQESIRPRLDALDRDSTEVIKSNTGESLIWSSETKGRWVYRHPDGRLYNLNADGLLSTEGSDGHIRFIEAGVERDIVIDSLKSDLDGVAPKPKKESPFRHLAQVAFRLTHN